MGKAQLQNKKLMSRGSRSRRMRRVSRRWNISKASWRRCRSRRCNIGSKLVGSKLRRLQSLIPDGEGLQPDQLFLRTADYIMQLRLQLDVLRAVSFFYQPN